MSTSIAADLDDIFNIPRNGSNIKTDDSQEGAYAAVANGNDTSSFQDKASKINSKIAPIAATSIEAEYVTMPPKKDEPKVEALKVEKNVEPIKTDLLPSSKEGSNHDSRPQSISPERILSEAIPGKVDERKQPTEMASQPTANFVSSGGDGDESEEAEVRAEPECDEGSDATTSQSQQITIENEEGWLLESPAPKYNQFYIEKTRILPRLLRGGKVPVEQYRKEMAEAYVDTKVDMYDYEKLSEKMTEIRQWQTRILQIRGHVLAQFHSWSRAVELFHGILARAEYAKPAICQQGLNYNHMRDFELYLCDLEYLHDFSKEMLINLANHFESLSRQVTLSMPLKTVERYENTLAPLPPAFHAEVQNVSKTKVDLSGFDRLENGVEQKDFSPQKSNTNVGNQSKIKTPEKVTKKVSDWSDID